MILSSRENCVQVMRKVRKTYISLEPPAAQKGALDFGWVFSYALYRGYVNSKDMVLFYARLDNGVALNLGQTFASVTASSCNDRAWPPSWPHSPHLTISFPMNTSTTFRFRYRDSVVASCACLLTSHAAATWRLHPPPI
jgi:hypothetical protein